MPQLYGYRPAPPPEVEDEVGESEDESPPMRGLFVAGEIKNLSLEADMEPLEEAISALGIAMTNIEMALESLPKRIVDAEDPEPPLDLSPVTEAIDRLAAMMEKHRASEKEDEGAPVTQTIRRDSSGQVVSITTKKGNGPARVRTVIRNADGYISGTVEK